MLVFLQGLQSYLRRSPKEQTGHHTDDDEVELRRLRRPHAAGRDHDRDVSDRIFATTEPDRSHIRVPVSVFHEKQDADQVCGQREKAYRAHDLRLRHVEHQKPIGGRSEYPRRNMPTRLRRRRFRIR